MDPLGGLIGLIGAGVNASNQGLGAAIAMANLQWQKQQALKQERLAMAARGDLYGNKQQYDPALNEWKIKLTPIQQDIINAQQREQKLSLTEDAMRNRELRKRLAERSRLATDEYYKTEAGFKYDQPPSEDAITHKLAMLIAQAKNEKARASMAPVAMEALRTGQGGLIPQMIHQINQQLGQETAQTLLQARGQAVQEKASRDSAHNSKYLPALQYYSQIMDDGGGGANLMFSTLPQEKAQEQTQNQQMILRAMESGGANVGNAYGNLAKIMSQPINFPTKGFGDMGMGGRTNSNGVYRLRPEVPDYSSIWSPDTLREAGEEGWIGQNFDFVGMF